jgi:hypothetical protein
MSRGCPARVLVVAHRTAATPLLLNAVRARSARSSCSFTLLVPRPYWDPDTEEAELTLELAIPLLEETAGGHVDGIIGDFDPFVAIRQAVDECWRRRDHHLDAAGAGVAMAAPGPAPPRQGIRIACHGCDCPAVRARGNRAPPSQLTVASPPRRAGSRLSPLWFRASSGARSLRSLSPSSDSSGGARRGTSKGRAVSRVAPDRPGRPDGR